MKYPNFINNNGRIGIIAPSDGSSDNYKKNKYKNAIKRLEKLGYKLEISNNLFKSINGRSSDTKTRASEVNDMFKNKNIDLILCACGGEFLIETLPYINFNYLVDNPKYVCGFSDPTGILYTLTTKYDIATIYGKNLSNFGTYNLHKSEEDFLSIINGKQIIQKNYSKYEDERSKKETGLENYNLTKKVKYKSLDNKDTIIKGRIIGGCFDIISELCATKYDGFKSFNNKYKKDGIIWYFDNCDKNLEDTIRILWKFNEEGYFDNAKGIIFGRFGNTSSRFYKNVASCLKDSVISKLNIPIIYDSDISHKGPCLNIINGSIATVELKNNKCSISFELK